MPLFESKIDKNTIMDYIANKIADAFEGRCVESKSEKNKKLSIKET